MLTGVLVCESLRAGASLTDHPLTLTKISRITVGDATADQPQLWTLVDFQAPDADAEALAAAFSDTLEHAGGWYVEFHTPTESFVVFAGRVFRYRRGDPAGRAEAADHARSLGVPETQLDWAT